MEFYYENHIGERINFYDSPYILTSHSFMDWQLSYDTVQNVSSGFRLDSKSIPFALRILPRIENEAERKAEYKRLLNNFVDIVSKDVDVPGKLWTTNGQYLLCRIVVSRKSGWKRYLFVTESCELLCDYPAWIADKSYDFIKPDSTEDANRYLDFAHLSKLYDVETGDYIDFVPGSSIDANDMINVPVSQTEYLYQTSQIGYEANGEYAYDFMCEQSGQRTVVNSGNMGANYRLTMYGAIQNPYIVIDDMIIGLDAVLLEGEYAVIDSAERTVYKVGNDGKKTNLFNSRTKTNAIFDKISPGSHSVVWPGTFGFNLTLYEERREPKWT